MRHGREDRRRAAEVAIDVGHHVVYAAVTGAIYELLDESQRARAKCAIVPP